MVWPVRRSLRRRLDELLAMFPPEELEPLRGKMSAWPKTETARLLQLVRAESLDFARLRPSARKSELRSLDPQMSATRVYAAAAWTARAVVLLELLELRQLDGDASSDAAFSALLMLDEFDGDDAWLWPLPLPSPWPDLDP